MNVTHFKVALRPYQTDDAPLIYEAATESVADIYPWMLRVWSDHDAWINRIEGQHTLKLGFDGRLIRVNLLEARAPSGEYPFSAAFTQGPDPLRASATAVNPSAAMVSRAGVPADPDPRPATAARESVPSASPQSSKAEWRRSTLIQ